MRVTLRLLASVKSGRYLQPGHPTGLTGLFNHPSPRSALIYVYGSTLERLKSLPEHSVYRQSTEAITKHRLQIIQSIKPEGYEEWAKRAAETLEKFPEAFKPGGTYQYQSIGGEPYVSLRDGGQYESENEEASAESAYPERVEPPAGAPGEMTEMRDIPGWEGQPPLEASQVEDAENQIGAGLIEEVIEVAEGELKLVDTMLKSKVWEELEEKPQPGQWDYFARDQHTKPTQEPANK